jgi:nitric oxide reductase NorD protein
MRTSPAHAGLDAEELHQRLETLVYPVLTARRSVLEPARVLAGMGRAGQERFLESLALITGTSVELGYNFCMFAPPALSLLDDREWPDWVLHLMDRYDRGGVIAAIVAMQRVSDYVEQTRAARAGMRFEEVAGVLERLVLGLNGRALKLSVGEVAHTDTETLYLPAIANRFESREDNFRLYKTTVIHLWAQTWFGTWRMSLAQAARHFDRPEWAVRLFHALETLRLDACIARELPGVFRDIGRLRAATGCGALPPPWEQAAARLRARGATVRESYELLPAMYREENIPEPACYQGELFPDEAEQVMALRLLRERESLGRSLAAIVARDPAPGESRKAAVADAPERRFSIARMPSPDMPDGFRAELRLNGEPVAALEDVQQILDSVLQDLGDIPDHYLMPAGHGVYRADKGSGAQPAESPARGEGGYRYDEWDYVRKQYRRDWCVLYERDVHPQWDDFVAETLHKYRGLLKHLRRTFEALRGGDRLLKSEPHGDDIDIDAVVGSYADRRAGLEGSERLFIRRRRIERDIAVMFLVDMSGSTKGWINDIERESLVLLCEVLETLGDRYAIYGFSGFTHKRCELLRIKHLDEPYGEEVRARISGIRPQDYTRMGVAIRHLSARLNEVEARTRLLITLSDGRPDDQDGYRGVYGIEDTRKALLEAAYQGIHPYCITIDDEARDYLPHMFGGVNFTVISELHRLPYKVSDIYRRITL